jgi:hypothetical protein
MSHYVQVRQEYLVSHAHASTAQACTILVTGIPPKYLSEFTLTRLFNHLPGGVREVWINRDLGDMPELYNRRLKACNTLESTATSLLNMAIKRDNKKKKKGGTTGGYTDDKSEGDPEVARKVLVEDLVPRQDRPSHRLPPFSWLPFSIPFMGKKVDTIEWTLEQVHELNTQLGQRREVLARDIARTSAAEAETTVRTHHIGAGKAKHCSTHGPCHNPPCRNPPRRRLLRSDLSTCKCRVYPVQPAGCSTHGGTNAYPS